MQRSGKFSGKNSAGALLSGAVVLAFLLPSAAMAASFPASFHGQHAPSHASQPRQAAPQNSQPSNSKPLIVRRQPAGQPQSAPAPQAPPRSPTAPRPAEGPQFRAGAPGQPPVYRSQPNMAARPGHLGEWMQQHQNLSPQDQQRALEREPGFNRLPPDQQARMRARLQQLNQMPPEQRQQVLNRVEGMEGLSPEQRQHITRTMGQLRALPPDQKQQVTRAFAQVRRLPPDQREAAARSYGAQMNPQQREAFNNLVKAEPYLPIQRPPVPPPPVQ